TSASAPSAWVSGTNYQAGAKVSFSGHDYKAKFQVGASAPPAWVNGNAYNQNDAVSFSGHNYIAKKAIVSVHVDPATNTAEWVLDGGTTDPATTTAQWLADDGEYSTNSRVGTSLGGATSSIGTAATPYGSVASDAMGVPPPSGTSAEVYGTVYALGAVHVRAGDNLSVFGVAGAVAGGFVGVGVAVIILNVKSNTDAGIGGSANV